MTKSSSSFNDEIIRPSLRTTILFNQDEIRNTVVIEELGICRGQVRVDMALVNGTIQGFEIKSDRDSLSRLYGQVNLYGKVLDRATLVVGDRHKLEVLDMLPEWWGILTMFEDTENPSFYSLRPAKTNPSRDPRALVELIWRDEAIEMLEQRNLADGVKSKPRAIIWDKVCEHFTLDEIASVVRTKLKTRAAIKDRSRPKQD